MTATECRYPLLPTQEAVLFQTVQAESRSMYVLQICWTIDGPFDVARAEAAWDVVLQRHPGLRSAFVWDAEGPRQVVGRDVNVPIARMDWWSAGEDVSEERLRSFLDEDRARAFPPDQPPLMRLTWIRTGDRTSRLIWTYHHLLLDGWSVQRVIREVFAAYAALMTGARVPRGTDDGLERFHRWYAAWDPHASRRFWTRSLAGLDTPTYLAPRPAGRAGGVRYQIDTFQLSERDTQQLTAYARRHRLTLGSVLVGAWMLLLRSQCRSDDVVCGVVLSGRPSALRDADTLVGMFVNTVPLRLPVDAAESLPAFFARVQDAQLDAADAQFLPLAEIQRCSALDPQQSLFDHVIAFENFPREAPAGHAAGAAAGPRVSMHQAVDQSNYPLAVMIGPSHKLSISFRYYAEWLSPELIAALALRYTRILRAIAHEPLDRVGDVRLVDEDDRAALLQASRGEMLAAAASGSLHERFAHHARTQPDSVAVSYGDQQITYGELDRRSDGLAAYLRQAGVVAETPIALYLERSVEMIAAILAVLKAGGVYVPLDPTYPIDHVRFVLNDSLAARVLTTRALADRIADGGVPRDCLEDVLHAQADGDSVEQPRVEWPRTDIQQLAYVIYTSGSTGRPKGVMIAHQQVLVLMDGTSRLFEPGPGDVWTMFHSYAFDFSVWEIWGALLHGGRLRLVDYTESRSPDIMWRTLADEQVTVFSQTPSAFAQLLANPPSGGLRAASLRTIVFGGEALRFHTLGPWLERPERTHATLVNMFGITETTVHVTARTVGLDEIGGPPASLIGRAIPGWELYLRDADGELVPVGQVGELWVGGEGLARGYLRRPALTADRFRPHPFGRAGARLYRSGDLARRGADGDLDYLGRADQQVKVRGFRIELGEIEHAIAEHETVGDVALIARVPDDGETRLEAYVTAARGQVLDERALRTHVHARLPEHMRPAEIVTLERLPLTVNGKIDRAALKPIERETTTARGESPRTASQILIASIWAEVLEKGHVGLDDDFFELGGHSVLTIRVMTRLRAATGIAVPLPVFYECPTVRALAAHLDAARGGAETGDEADADCVNPTGDGRGDANGDLPLSYEQEQLWRSQDADPASSGLNSGVALRLRGPLSIEAIDWSVSTIVARHATLRTRIITREGRPVQVIDPPPSAAAAGRLSTLRMIDLSGLSAADAEGEARLLTRREAERPFALDREPPLRAALLRLTDADHVVSWNVHHIACDGWSLGILASELSESYRARIEQRTPALAPLPIQYADYARAQRRAVDGGHLQREIGYWQRQLSALPPLDLPTDYPDRGGTSAAGATHALVIDAPLTQDLTTLSGRAGVTLFMTLLSAFKVLLSRYTSHTDIVVATDAATRYDARLEPLIGCFVNVLLLRTELGGARTFGEVLRRVRATAVGAYAHSRVPFEAVYQRLEDRTHLGRGEQFVMFVLLNATTSTLDLGGAAAAPLSRQRDVAQFNLAVSILPAGGRLHVQLEYRTALFTPQTVARLASRYHDLLTRAAASPDGAIDELLLDDEAHGRQMMAAFNEV